MPRGLSSATAAKELGPGGWGGRCSDPVKGSTAEKRARNNPFASPPQSAYRIRKQHTVSPASYTVVADHGRRLLDDARPAMPDEPPITTNNELRGYRLVKMGTL